jgi:hypothetical protein
MRYIKLFENFDSIKENTKDTIFDWMPFDDQMANPIQSSIPEELSMKELINFTNESTNSSQIQEAGLFMAHRKNSDGGFTRYITKSISPLIFEAEIFNSKFESVNKLPNIDASSFDLDSFQKGASMMGRFGIFGKK